MSSLGNPAVNQPAGAVGADRGRAAVSSPSTSATSTSHPAPMGFANPTSDGRTVVVTGFRKGMAGPEAKQMALGLCAQFGGISACWLRKGKSSCWFVIVHFTEVIPVSLISACLMRSQLGESTVPLLCCMLALLQTMLACYVMVVCMYRQGTPQRGLA